MNRFKITYLFIVMLVVFTANGFLSCKKDKKPDTTTLEQLIKDENKIASSEDEISKDISSILSGSSNKSTTAFPCNVTVDSSTIIGDTIIYNITFNGLNCSGRWFRSGQAVVYKHIATQWIQAGTTVRVKYLNVQFKRVADNLTVILNGTKYFTNVTGGRLDQLGTTYSSITHKVTGYLTATFDDNSVRTWTLTRQLTYTGTLGNLWVSINGFGSANGYDNLVAWGTNRHGELFYSQIQQTIICKESCNFDPCAGVKIHSIPEANLKATFTAGYDLNNNPVDVNSNTCPTKYRIDWEKNGLSGTIYRFL